MNNITQDFHNSITQTLTHQPDKLSSAQPERQQMKHHLRQEGQFYSSSKAQSNQAFASGLNQEAPMSPVEKGVSKLISHKRLSDESKFTGLIDMLASAQSKEDKGAVLLGVITFLTNVNQRDARVQRLSPVVSEFISSNSELIKELQSDDHRDLLGGVLVESLRCSNFANHSSNNIENFIDLFRELGFNIDGDPHACAQLATFSLLSYEPGRVIMKP